MKLQYPILLVLLLSASPAFGETPAETQCKQICEKVIATAVPAEQLSALKAEQLETFREIVAECVVECAKESETVRACLLKANTEAEMEACGVTEKKDTTKKTSVPSCKAVCDKRNLSTSLRHSSA